MNWNIQKFIVCPDTGTMYSLAVSAKNLQMILWCKGDYFLRQGSVMDSTPFGMVVNGKVRKIQVLHAFPIAFRCGIISNNGRFAPAMKCRRSGAVRARRYVPSSFALTARRKPRVSEFLLQTGWSAYAGR